MPDKLANSGVQQLIDRIRDDGVRSAREEAERLVTEARAEAAHVLAGAHKEADALRKSAREEIETDRTAAIEALRVAARDTGLALRTAVFSAFQEHVRRLVTDVTAEGTMLRDLILVLAGRAAEELIQDKNVAILIPKHVTDAPPEELEAFLKSISAAISGNVLREGIELIPATDLHGGARVRLKDSDLEIDLSDQALSQMMLDLLLPRYRAILVEAGQ